MLRANFKTLGLIVDHPYDALSPDTVIDAVESQDLLSDLRILALNSYENRVYQVGIDEQQPMIAKFYRPERWSRDQILEEHVFCQELKDLEIPVVEPWQNSAGETLFEHGGFYFSLYRRQGGQAPDLGDYDKLLSMGRVLGRIHNLGLKQDFVHRPSINLETYGINSREYLLNNDFIPASLLPAYESLSADLVQRMTMRFADTPVTNQRCHGDCHIGNILWRDGAPHFVDFDDARMAPAIQDLWMLLSGPREQQSLQLSEVLEGYREFADFNSAELNILESMRTLRLMYYSAWLARRWKDPAFPKAFPWFNTERYWAEHILELREQLAALDEPPLMVY